MANVCLPPKDVENIKTALKDGKLNLDDLRYLTSEERHAKLAAIVGEGQAKWVNAGFEEKLLLKNQRQGYNNWVKQVTGISENTRKDLIDRIAKLDKVLDPHESDAFMKDLAATKLGVDVTREEAKSIAEMSQKVREAEAKRSPDGTFPTTEDRYAYGYAREDMRQFLADKKLEGASKRTLMDRAKNPRGWYGSVDRLSRSLTAALDDSAVFRQGWKAMSTNPVIWGRNALKTISDATKTVRGQNVLRHINADIISRPNAELYNKMDLKIGGRVDEFLSPLPERIKVIGRGYKASEAAYTGFLHRTRADLADKYIETAKKAGTELTDEQLKSMGKVINSLTGHGDTKGIEALNSIFFSPSFIRSNFDVLTAHALDPHMTKQMRIKSATNLVKIVAGTAAALSIAKVGAQALGMDASVETDARSSDFGKLKIGDTRFDLSGGMGTLIVLADQMIRGEKKSTTSGVINKAAVGFRQDSRFDYFVNFITNKTAPAASVVRDLWKSADPQGNKPTVKGEVTNLFKPMGVGSVKEAHDDPHGANAIFTAVMDGLGMGANTYSNTNRSTDSLVGKAQEAFKKQIGDKKYEEANKEFEKRVNNWMADNKSVMDGLSNDEKKADLTAVKAKIQKGVYKDYGFTPPKADKNSDAAKTKRSILSSVK